MDITFPFKKIATVLAVAVFVLSLLAAAFAQTIGGSSQSLFATKMVGEPAPADIQDFADTFNGYQLTAKWDYNEWDVTYQPKMAGMDVCWSDDGSTLTYVMKRGDSFYASIIDSASDGSSEVISSGNDSSRWDKCNSGAADTNADM